MSSSDYSTFTPNSELLESMLAMGIDSETAKIALYKTGNESCDAAIAYVFDNIEMQEQAENAEVANMSSKSSVGAGSRTRLKVRDANRESEETVSDANLRPYKMVFIVNASLEMGVGKTAAQVAHGALGLYRALLEDDTANNEALEHWEDGGERKIVLQGQHQDHLLQLRETANSIGLLTYLVHDAGLTEVIAGALTVLAIFGVQEQVDSVTGDLNLL